MLSKLNKQYNNKFNFVYDLSKSYSYKYIDTCLTKQFNKLLMWF